LAVVNGIDHCTVVETRLLGQLDAPFPLEWSAGVVVVYFCVTGQEVVQGTEVARPLDVVVPAQWIASRARASVVTGEQQKVAESCAGVGPIVMLGQTHGPQRTYPVGLSYPFRG